MKRRITLISILILVALTALTAACSRAAQTVESPRDNTETVAEEAAMEAPAAAPAFAGDGDDFAFDVDMALTANIVEGEAVLQPGQERLIIRTADVSIVATNTDDALARISAMANENGGWVVSSNVFQASEDAKTGNITIRVPAAGFQSALDAIQALAVEVTQINTSGQDVTEEFVDLESRLANLEATADRVRAFLDETRNVEEALSVNMELSRLEGEIEVIKGRMQYLSQSAAFSTISVNITPDILAQPIEVGGWQPQGVAREAIEALVATLQNLASALIWLGIYFLPVILLIVLPILVVVWLVRRFLLRRRTQSSAVQPAE